MVAMGIKNQQENQLQYPVNLELKLRKAINSRMKIIDDV
jgi:hypothetical protein